MRLTEHEKKLASAEPLMKCGNRLEFQQRLEWLSEGMLRNHLSGVVNYTVSQSEIDLYREFKEAKA
jgi:hypothetical protein